MFFIYLLFFNSYNFFIVGLFILLGVHVISINVCLGVGHLAKNLNLDFFFLEHFLFKNIKK